MARDSEKIEGLIAGLELFKNLGVYNVDAQHDVLFAGLDSKLTDEQQAKLEKWGWLKNTEYGCWQIFT